MVQGNTRTAAGLPITTADKKADRPKDAHTSRKAAPNKRKSSGSIYEKHNRSVTASIARNIEEIMASRLVHEGGKLKVVPMPEKGDKFNDSRARVSSRQMADLRKATKARMGRQQRDGTNALQEGLRGAKKSKSNKLGPRKGATGGVDSDDEEYRRIMHDLDEEIIPRDDVIVPDSSDEDMDSEGEEEKQEQEKSDSEQPTAKRQKGSDGKAVAGGSDEESESEAEERPRKKGVKTMLSSWMEARKKKSAAPAAAEKKQEAPAAKQPAFAAPAAAATAAAAPAPAPTPAPAPAKPAAAKPAAPASSSAATAPAAAVKPVVKPAAAKPAAAPATPAKAQPQPKSAPKPAAATPAPAPAPATSGRVTRSAAKAKK